MTFDAIGATAHQVLPSGNIIGGQSTKDIIDVRDHFRTVTMRVMSVLVPFVRGGVTTIQNDDLSWQIIHETGAVRSQSVWVGLGYIANDQRTIVTAMIDVTQPPDPGEQTKFVIVLERIVVFIGSKEENVVENTGQIISA